MAEDVFETNSGEQMTKAVEVSAAQEATSRSAEREAAKTEGDRSAREETETAMEAEAGQGVRIVRLPDASNEGSADAGAGKPGAVLPDKARRAAAVQRARELNRARNVKRDKVGVGGMIFMCVAIGACVMLLLCLGLYVLSILGRAFGG